MNESSVKGRISEVMEGYADNLGRCVPNTVEGALALTQAATLAVIAEELAGIRQALEARRTPR